MTGERHHKFIELSGEYIPVGERNRASDFELVRRREQSYYDAKDAEDEAIFLQRETTLRVQEQQFLANKLKRLQGDIFDRFSSALVREDLLDTIEDSLSVLTESPDRINSLEIGKQIGKLDRLYPKIDEDVSKFIRFSQEHEDELKHGDSLVLSLRELDSRRNEVQEKLVKLQDRLGTTGAYTPEQDQAYKELVSLSSEYESITDSIDQEMEGLRPEAAQDQSDAMMAAFDKEISSFITEDTANVASLIELRAKTALLKAQADKDTGNPEAAAHSQEYEKTLEDLGKQIQAGYAAAGIDHTLNPVSLDTELESRFSMKPISEGVFDPTEFLKKIDHSLNKVRSSISSSRDLLNLFYEKSRVDQMVLERGQEVMKQVDELPEYKKLVKMRGESLDKLRVLSEKMTGLSQIMSSNLLDVGSSAVGEIGAGLSRHQDLLRTHGKRLQDVLSDYDSDAWSYLAGGVGSLMSKQDDAAPAIIEGIERLLGVYDKLSKVRYEITGGEPFVLEETIDPNEYINEDNVISRNKALLEILVPLSLESVDRTSGGWEPQSFIRRTNKLWRVLEKAEPTEFPDERESLQHFMATVGGPMSRDSDESGSMWNIHYGSTDNTFNTVYGSLFSKLTERVSLAEKMKEFRTSAEGLAQLRDQISKVPSIEYGSLKGVPRYKEHAKVLEMMKNVINSQALGKNPDVLQKLQEYVTMADVPFEEYIKVVRPNIYQWDNIKGLLSDEISRLYGEFRTQKASLQSVEKKIRSSSSEEVKAKQPSTSFIVRKPRNLSEKGQPVRFAPRDELTLFVDPDLVLPAASAQDVELDPSVDWYKIGDEFLTELADFAIVNPAGLALRNTPPHKLAIDMIPIIPWGGDYAWQAKARADVAALKTRVQAFYAPMTAAIPDWETKFRDAVAGKKVYKPPTKIKGFSFKELAAARDLKIRNRIDVIDAGLIEFLRPSLAEPMLSFNHPLLVEERLRASGGNLRELIRQDLLRRSLIGVKYSEEELQAAKALRAVLDFYSTPEEVRENQSVILGMLDAFLDAMEQNFEKHPRYTLKGSRAGLYESSNVIRNYAWT
jgi:hypothetical protein